MSDSSGRWRPSPRFGRQGGVPAITGVPAKGGRPWPLKRLISVACVPVVVLAAAGLYLLFGGGEPAAAEPTNDSWATAAPLQQAAITSTPMPMPTERPGAREQTAIDISALARQASSAHKNLTKPSVDYAEMVYSAGTGKADRAVLTELYLYDMIEDTERLIAKSQLKPDGEIYEAHVSKSWIVYIDTDQNGNNRICFVDRRSGLPEDGLPESVVIDTTKYAMPRLSLYDDSLIWIQQNAEMTDDIWFFDLASGGENFVLTTVTGSASYGVSPPSIHGNEVIWAAENPENPTARDSAIYVCRLNELGGDELVFEYYLPGVYVHAPVTNGRVWAWLDNLKSTVSTLYLMHRNGNNLTPIAENVIHYALGDGVLLYCTHDFEIFAYFYEQGIYARLTPEGGKGMQPAIDPDGRYAAWYDISGDISVDTFMYMEVVLPGEVAPPSPTPRPSPSPTPRSEPIEVDEEGNISGATNPPLTSTPQPPATSAPGTTG